MSSWQDARVALGDVIHEAMGDDATYTPAGGGTPVPCRVRLRLGVRSTVLGFDGATPETYDTVRFLRHEVVPAIGGLVSSGGESWRVDEIESDDGIRVVTRVIPA